MKTTNLIILIVLLIIGGSFWAWIKIILKNNAYPVTSELLFSDLKKMLHLIRNTAKPRVKKKYTFIYLASILSFSLGLIAFFTGIKERKVVWCEEFNEFLTQEVDGIVIDKFIDYPNHAIEKLTLIKNNRLVTGADIRQFGPEIYNYIQIGDTLKKEKNSPYILVANRERTKKIKFTYLDCNQLNQ